MINPLDIQQLRAQFNRAALTYDQAAVLPHTVAESLLERLQTIRIHPAFILDLGCRTGYSTQALRKFYPAAELTSLEQAEGFLQQVHRKARLLGQKTRCVCSQLGALPFKSNHFDLIYSNLTLHWSENYTQTFSEVYRLLRPGGLFLFSTVGVDTLTELRACWQKIDNKIHVHSFPDMHDVGDSLLHTGFSEPVLDVEYFTIQYHHCRSLLQDLKALGAQNLASDRYRGLTTQKTRQALEYYYEQLRSSAGKLPATWEVIYGQGWKPIQDMNTPAYTEATIAIHQIGGRKAGSKS